MKLIKKVVKKDGKRYTNYYVEFILNDKVLRVGIEPKRYGKDWSDPQVRSSFTILDLLAEVEYDGSSTD